MKLLTSKYKKTHQICKNFWEGTIQYEKLKSVYHRCYTNMDCICGSYCINYYCMCSQGYHL